MYIYARIQHGWLAYTAFTLDSNNRVIKKPRYAIVHNVDLNESLAILLPFYLLINRHISCTLFIILTILHIILTNMYILFICTI